MRVVWALFSPRRLAILVALGAGASLLRGPEPAQAGGAGSEADRVELGRRLFFDPLASRSGARSSSSCHDPLHGFSDPATRSPDDVGRTKRHSQTILDSHLNPTAHWDGEFDSIEELVLARLDRVNGTRSPFRGGPFSGLGENGGAGARGGRSGGGYGGPPATTPPTAPPEEPRDPQAPPPDPADPDATADDDAQAAAEPPGPAAGEAPDGGGRTDAAGGRKQRLAKAGSEPGPEVLPLDLTKLPHVADLIESSGRYAEGFKAAFGSPRVTSARIADAIATYCRSVRSTEAPLDRHLRGEAGALSESARRGLALFRGRAGCVQCHVMEGSRPTFTDFRFHNTGIAFKTAARGRAPDEGPLDLDEREQVDLGRSLLTTQSNDRRAFKTATLRDLTRRGPYMHDGAFETLADVVRHYAAGGSPKDERQDPRLRPFGVTDAEVADLVAFLESLTGDEQPGRVTTAWSARAALTRVRLIDGRGRPLAGLSLELVEEGDRMPGWSEDRRVARRVTTDADGAFEFEPGQTTHVRLALPDGLPATGGLLVPDTCARAVVEVPVDGRVTLVLSLAPGANAPERLVAEHEGTMRLPGHLPPRTVLTRASLHELGGRRLASYEGWLRTDVPPRVIVRVPGDRRADPDHRVTLVAGKTVRLDLGG